MLQLPFDRDDLRLQFLQDLLWPIALIFTSAPDRLGMMAPSLAAAGINTLE
jgi:hypothetical protein